MPRFPTKEAEIERLALEIINGLIGSPYFMSPPLGWIALYNVYAPYKSARNKVIKSQAQAQMATENKDDAFDDLTEAMKKNIRYAENTVGGDNDKLKLIGWSGRKARAELTPPGQPRSLEITKQGTGWISLDWKKPLNGGNPKIYNILRRENSQGKWLPAGSAVETESVLVDQPVKSELEYRVVAVNKAGEGEPSNTVTAVL